MTKLDYCSFPVVRNCVTSNLRSFNVNANLLIYLSKSCSWFSITPLTVALNQKEFANSKRLRNARSALISRQLVRVTYSFPHKILSEVMPSAQVLEVLLSFQLVPINIHHWHLRIHRTIVTKSLRIWKKITKWKHNIVLLFYITKSKIIMSFLSVLSAVASV